MNRKITLILLSFIAMLIFSSIFYSCGSDQGKGQSINNGLALFKTNCSACHQEDGNGLASLYPPLNNSDYFKKNRTRLPCIIRNGLNGSIKVNGVVYDQQMPGIGSLSPEEIADISNYVSNNFNRMDSYTNPDEVSKVLSSCQ